MYFNLFLKIFLYISLSSIYLQSEAFNLLAVFQEISNDPNDVTFFFYPVNGKPVYEKEIIFGDPSSLKNSGISQSSQKTILLIHGFTDNRTSRMDSTILGAYLKSNLNYNFLIVDWGPLSGNRIKTHGFKKLARYPKVVDKSIPIVATRTTQFIQQLVQFGIKEETIHIIGHSLGGHISGRVGNLYQQSTGGVKKIGRITGLDPAGPLFELKIHFRKIKKGDATFVDVIHSNAGALGDDSANGDADFWPNGGNNQPGCEALGDSCDHQFSPKLYATSITKDFVACKCVLVNTGREVLLKGSALDNCLNNCPGNNTILLGERCPDSARGLYSLRTGVINS